MTSLMEKERLRALRSYRILDTEPEDAFDQWTRAAAEAFDVPISAISFVDGDRQWFKSSFGLDLPRETVREHAFCAHAIQDEQIMVVPDATKDDRFANNPLVYKEPGIRFYAGAPLSMASGFRLGTLCIIDQRPQLLNDSQRQLLSTLRTAVVNQLELRKAQEDLRRKLKMSICAWCGSIKQFKDASYDWQDMCAFLQKHFDVSHAICPACRDIQMSGKLNN